MLRSINLIIIIALTGSIHFSREIKLPTSTIKITDKNVKNSSINLSIESQEDIYGVQFDIRYNPDYLILTEEMIRSKIPNVKIYSRIREEGVARVLMFSMAGQKLLDGAVNKITNLIDIQFKPKEEYKGSNVVEIFDITIAGKGGIELNLNKSSSYMFEVSFLLPNSSSLSKNYPNPFILTTTIDYELSEDGMVSLIVSDLKGTIVKTLINEYQKASYHSIMWHGLNESNQEVMSGRYILKMATPGFSDSIVMTLLK